MTQWNGYVERHNITDADRKLNSQHARLAREPEITLSSPEEVSNWIIWRLVELTKSADAEAQTKNNTYDSSRQCVPLYREAGAQRLHFRSRHADGGV
jgi:hypothetical protein